MVKNLDELKILSDTITKITHNRPEGMKCALVIATCIFMSIHKKTKDGIREYAISQYPEIALFDYEDLRKNYGFMKHVKKVFHKQFIVFYF